MNEEQDIKRDLADAVNRINDMLQNDDGQAFKEARKWVEQMRTKYGIKEDKTC